MVGPGWLWRVSFLWPCHLPSSFFIPPGQPPWLQALLKHARQPSLLSSFAQAVPSAPTLFLQACRSFHCTLRVFAQKSPFQETILLAKPALTIIALCPLVCFILLPRTIFGLYSRLPAQQQRLQEGSLVPPDKALDEAPGAHRPLSPCSCAPPAASGGV